MDIKKYIIENRKDVLSEDKLVEFKRLIKEKYNVDLPKDYIDFLGKTNGFWFQGCERIFGFDTNNSVIEETDELKEMMLEWETVDISTFEDFVVLGTIYEHGYLIYLNKSKYYVLVEDLFNDFTLDGRDEKLLKINNIYDVFIYYDYNVGDKVFEKEYKKIFSSENEKEEKLENYKQEMKESINKLTQDSFTNNAILKEVVIDQNYLDILKSEYKQVKVSNVMYIYGIGVNFKIYINFESKQMEIIRDDKIQTRLFEGPYDNTITNVIDRKNYFVIVTDSKYVEPIILDKKLLTSNEIKKIKNMLGNNMFKAFFDKFKI